MTLAMSISRPPHQHLLDGVKEGAKCMNGSKEESMKSEAQQWARELEFIGRDVLAHCEHCSRDQLHWSPPYLGLSSLWALATQLIWEVEHWVFIQIGEKRLACPNNFQDPSESTYDDLKVCYQEWIHQAHLLLDPLPDSFLNLSVGPRFGTCAKRRRPEVPTVRMCLFSAIERCAALLGKIEVIEQLAPNNKSLSQKFKTEMEEGQVSEKVVLHTGSDASSKFEN
jgi:hypothetical protein